MRGMEHACFANSICGEPVEWKKFLPSYFFDSFIFHKYLLNMSNGKKDIKDLVINLTFILLFLILHNVLGLGKTEQKSVKNEQKTKKKIL
jgi:hypothetical protein